MKGERKLMERIGELDIVPATYRVLADVTKFAELYKSAPKSLDEAEGLKIGVLKQKQVKLSQFAFVAGSDNLSQIYGEIEDGENKGNWVLLLSIEAGAIFERIQPGKWL